VRADPDPDGAAMVEELDGDDGHRLRHAIKPRLS
jgi:hypothetical protein